MKFYIHFLQSYSFDAILYCISGLNSLSLQHENNLQHILRNRVGSPHMAKAT